MKTVKLGILILTALILTGISISAVAGQEGYPNKTVTIYCPWSAGGSTDLTGRMVANKMTEIFDEPVIVVNKTGGGSFVANAAVYKAAPDGYTFIVNASSSIVLSPHLRKAPFEPLELTPVMSYGMYPFVLAVRADAPWQTIQEFVEHARKNPGKIKTASASTGSSWFEGNQIMLATTGIKIKPIPYLKSGRQVPLGLLQGEIDVGNCGLHETIDFIRSGKLRCLAVFDKKPIKLPNGMVLPAIVDSLPELEKYAPHGGGMALAVRRDAPVEVLEKIRDHFVAAIRHPEFRKFMARTYYFDEIYTGEAADWQAAFRETVFDWLSMDLKVKDIKNTPAELGLPRVEDFDAWWPPKGYKPRISSKVRPIQ